MLDRQTDIILAVVATLAIAMAGCDDGIEACVEYCEDCPHQMVVPDTTRCEEGCAAWADIAELTGCEEVWEDELVCFEELSDCSSASGVPECDDPSIVDCSEHYCRVSDASRAECNQIWIDHGFTVGSD